LGENALKKTDKQNKTEGKKEKKIFDVGRGDQKKKFSNRADWPLYHELKKRGQNG